MRCRGSGGFTVVEVMIVLAISGVMFVTFAGMMSGRQAKAWFSASVSDVVTDIRQHINEVGSGYRPQTGTFSCSLAGGAPSITTAGAAAAGTNTDCTYIGQAVMADTANTGSYVLQGLVGARTTTTGTEPLTLAAAKTRVLDKGSGYPASWPNLGIQKDLQYGLTLKWMRDGTPGTTSNIAGFAIAAAPDGQLSMASGALQSGTIAPTIIPIPNAAGLVSRTQGVDLLVRALGGVAPVITAPAGKVQLCFQSGTSNQTALVTVNTDGSVQSAIFNTSDCS